MVMQLANSYTNGHDNTRHTAGMKLMWEDGKYDMVMHRAGVNLT
jgi:hypothetical protein